MRRRFVQIRSFARAGAVALFVACATPTLPLPPPLAPTELGSSNGQVHLGGAAGSVEANATVVILNDDTSLPGDKRVGGALADATGAWDAWVYANSGDVLEITQEVATVTSPSTLIAVK